MPSRFGREEITMAPDARKPGTGINIFIDDDPPLTGVRIKVIGIGGGGGNAVNRMIESGIEGIEFLVANTDLQALERSRAPIKVQLGSRLTKGLGAGADPAVGREAALEDTDKIIEVLEGADMVFVVTGMGGGTGTGAAPIIASLATELNILTVGVVTKPFQFEGRRRMQQADLGLRELRECVDTVITIPNERLLHTAEKGALLSDMFRIADDVLRQAVQGISDLLTVPGLINLDFADVKVIISGMGMALMGAGHGFGENRAIEATQQAISSPLLEEASIQGAKGVMINITGGPDLTLYEVNAAAKIIRDEADEDANIIFGAIIDEAMRDEMRITVVATGFELVDKDTNDTTELFQSIEPPLLPDIVVAWNPELVAADDYVSLITALGDIVRSEGGLGVERLRSTVSISSLHVGPGGRGSGLEKPEEAGELT